MKLGPNIVEFVAKRQFILNLDESCFHPALDAPGLGARSDSKFCLSHLRTPRTDFKLLL